jgi:hypothetical protein
MSKTRFLLVPLTFLIIIGLLTVGGWATHRIGWSEGYRMGQLVAGGEAGAIAPYAPYGLSYFGLFLTVGLAFLLVLGLIGKLFRFWAWKAVGGPPMMAGAHWKMAGKPQGDRWARHWRRHHGPMPPWCWGWEKPPEEKGETARPDAETGDAASVS